MISRARCEAVIDGDALRHNAAFIRSHLGAVGMGQPAMMAVVKADAYGHGVGIVVPALCEAVDAFAVANITEAMEVRAFAPRHPLFLLSPCLPEEIAPAVGNGFIPAISTLEEARACAAAGVGSTRGSIARGSTLRVPIHLAIDTGMGRIGVWEEEAASLVRDLSQINEIETAFVSTHLPVADEDGEFTAAQLQRFASLVADLRPMLPASVSVHALNSAGILGFPGHGASMVRVGLALYGSTPLPSWQDRLRPAMTWRARIALVRDLAPGRSISYGRTYITPRPMRVATIAAGYADGYPRHLSGRGAHVLVGGRRCAVLGRVTMDQIMVDVSETPGVAPGDFAVLMGRDGQEEIPASELAEKAQTIAWEIFCRAGFGRREVRALQLGEL